MTTSEEGMEYVDIREKWPHEALNFTPWLARNLDLLSEAVGIKLELVQEEAAVGPFSCDILAKEVDSGLSAAIENQLEWTDHSHLTQLLTYAAGLDARIAIWVAPEFRYEHAATLHWLNEWTPDELRFYGVKVELVNVGDPVLEPRLSTVVSPEGWNEEITQPQGASISPRSQQFQAFFQPLITELHRAGFANQPTQMFGNNDRAFPSSLNPGIWYVVSLEGNNDAWVTLHIRAEDKDLTKRIFDALKSDQKEIEASITPPDQEWRWNRHNANDFSSVNMRKDGSIDDPLEKREETRAWMMVMLPKLKEIFEPRVEKILRDLSSRDGG